MTHHTQVQASRALVDEGMVSLLELLWERGYETEFSCQGGEDFKSAVYDRVTVIYTTEAYLSLPNFDDGVRFLREVYDSGTNISPKLELFHTRARLTWHHTHTEAIFQGLMSATVNA